MGRGQDNILGIFPTSKKRSNPLDKEVTETEDVSATNILFQPIKKQDNSLYRKNPAPAALRRANKIAEDMKEGNYLSFLMVLDSSEIDIKKYPAFREIFQHLSSGEMDKLLRARKIPRRGKEAKAEREFLESNSAEFLALRIQKALSAAQGMPVGEQANMLREISFIDDSFVAEVSLASDVQGPAKDYYLNSLRRKPLEGINSNSLSIIVDSKTDEAKDILQEILRREAVRVFHALRGRSSSAPRIEYGCLRMSYRGKSVLHLKGPSYGTLCGSRESMYSPGVAYGNWSDAPYSDSYKQCPKCLKAADEQKLQELEKESGDNVDPWIDAKGQEEMTKMTQDPRLKSLIRKQLKSGESTAKIQREVQKYLAPRVADVFVRAADDYRGIDNAVYGSGGGHILWEDLNYSFRNKLSGTGATIPRSHYGPSVFTPGQAKNNLIDEDVMMKATSAEERRKYFRYKARSLTADNHLERDKYLDQAQTILERAVRRFIRQEKKKS
jgi:hypothetical protein